MEIRASVRNGGGQNEIRLNTNGKASALEIPARESGSGVSVNGGELLFLALATCYITDLYREASKRHIEVTSVAVDVRGQFGAEGEGTQKVSYSAMVIVLQQDIGLVGFCVPEVNCEDQVGSA